MHPLTDSIGRWVTGHAGDLVGRRPSGDGVQGGSA